MAATYEPIATTTLGSASGSITFSSIPATYTDLVLICQVKRTSGGAEIWARLNSDTGSNYSWTYVYGTGSSAASSRTSNENNGLFFGITSNNDFGTFILHLQNYANTTTYKTGISRFSVANPVTNYQAVGANVALWRSTSAVTSLTVRDAGSTYVAGSTFTLYGIASA